MCLLRESLCNELLPAVGKMSNTLMVMLFLLLAALRIFRTNDSFKLCQEKKYQENTYLVQHQKCYVFSVCAVCLCIMPSTTNPFIHPFIHSSTHPSTRMTVGRILLSRLQSRRVRFLRCCAQNRIVVILKRNDKFCNIINCNKEFSHLQVSPEVSSHECSSKT